MLVFGDRIHSACPREGLEALRSAASEQPEAGEAWILRHAGLAELFIAAATLAQAILDAAFDRAHEERPDASAATIDAGMRALAGSVIRSWITGAVPPSRELLRPIAELAALPLPERIEIKEAEGYAYYALYPESYAIAAHALRGASPTVIGLRSIGLGLGAIVAAVTEAPLSLSLRPIGHPFRRELALGADLREALARRRDGLFAVVDEGPGLSGSSFAAVAGELETLGVARSRIHFFPSHRNPPGGAATSDIVERWQAAPKHVIGFEELALDAPEPRHRLAGWVEDLTGPALARLEDIGAGGWRRLRADLAGLPASPQKERRKFLLRSERGVFLLRFAGLGAKGRATLNRAGRLFEGGFTPEPLGLRHGFLVERWETDAQILDPRRDRAELIHHLAGYLAFRARHLSTPPASGATIAQLDAMRRQTISELFATAAPAALPPAPHESSVRRVQTDNRMHAWEWLRRRGGQILKTDAADHCDAHDLIGCQDIAWDAVGARIEFDLAEDEFSGLLTCLQAAVRRNIDSMREEERRHVAQLGWEAKLANLITRFAGSMRFIYIHLFGFGFWITANAGLLPHVPAWDPTFVMLGMIASVEAIFLSTFILISQNTMSAAADRRAALDLQINLLAEHEVTKLFLLVSAIAEKTGAAIPQEPALHEVRRDVRPEIVIRAIDEDQGE